MSQPGNESRLAIHCLSVDQLLSGLQVMQQNSVV